MRTVQTSHPVPLASVKPLEGLRPYRDFCLAATREALQGETQPFTRSPVTGASLEPYGEIEGVPYARCPVSGSVFLARRPEPAAWAHLLGEASRFRHAPGAFHAGLAQSRTDYVYAPKVEWIEDALRLQEVRRPVILEAASGPSEFSKFLRDSAAFAEVLTVEETALAAGAAPRRPVQAAVLFESLDRAHDPERLLRGVAERLAGGGLLFVTGLVCSGFDLAVLGLRNRYLYPPDRANCFSLQGLLRLLERYGFTPLEVSTPGMLDVEIVQSHLAQDPTLALSPFERRLLQADQQTQEAFQAFLQAQGLSSFARIVARHA